MLLTISHQIRSIYLEMQALGDLLPTKPEGIFQRELP